MTIIVITSNSIGIKDFRLPFLKEFLALGKKVVVLGPQDKHSEDLKNNILQPLGIIYEYISINNTSFDPIHDIKTTFDIIKSMIKYKPTYILNYTMKPTLYGTLASLLTFRRRVFSFVTGLGYLFTEENNKIKMLRLIFKSIYKVAFLFNERVFFQNIDDLREFDASLKNKKYVLIPGSGVDMKKYRLSPLGNEIQNPSFLFMGRLLRHKGILEYLNAAKIVKEKYPNVKFSVVGDFSSNPSGISPNELERWISLGTITYYGYQEDVREFIKNSTVFVLPSYREGLSRSILEAMSMGRPIITTDAPGCRDVIIDGESGFLVKKGDVTSLVAAMEKFIKEPKLALKMGHCAHKRVSDNYEIGIISKKTIYHLGLTSSS